MVVLHAVEEFEPASHLGVRLLGGFSVSIDGAEVAAERWPSLRSAQLVQLLSLAPQRRMTRDRVVDTLWPQLEPDAGAANLRKAAHHARQALGRHDGLVLHGGEVVLWAHGCVTVDVDRFEQLALAALAGSERDACARAVDAYGGDLLPGSAYEAWAEPARERLRARFIALLRASAQWERLARVEPSDEPAHRELMAREFARRQPGGCRALVCAAARIARARTWRCARSRHRGLVRAVRRGPAASRPGHHRACHGPCPGRSMAGQDRH